MDLGRWVAVVAVMSCAAPASAEGLYGQPAVAINLGTIQGLPESGFLVLGLTAEAGYNIGDFVDVGARIGGHHAIHSTGLFLASDLVARVRLAGFTVEAAGGPWVLGPGENGADSFGVFPHASLGIGYGTGPQEPVGVGGSLQVGNIFGVGPFIGVDVVFPIQF